MSASERLKFLIEADAKGAIAAFQATGNAAEKQLGKAQDRLNKLGGGLTKFGAGAMATAGVAAAGLFKLADGAEKMAIEAGKMADATGLTVVQASKWVEVAGDMGIEAGVVQKSLGFMNKAVGNGGDAFKQYHVAVVKAKDGTTDVNATFLSVVDRLNAIEDPAKRASAGAALLGKGWQNMAELVRTGSGTLKTSLDAVSDAKITTPEELAKAKDFRAAMDQMADAGQDLAISLGQGVAPMFATIAKGVGTAVDAFGKLDAVTGGAAGQFLGIGTAVVGAAGALSFISGKVITAHDRFATLFKTVNAEGVSSFTKLAKGLGAASAIAGAGVLVYSALSEEKEKARQVTDDFVVSLKAESEGQKGATLAAIAAKLAQSDALEVGRKLGLSAADIADVISGKSVPAWDELKNKIDATTPSYLSGEQKLAALQKTFGVAGYDVLDFATEIGNLAGAMSIAQTETANADAVNRAFGVGGAEAADAARLTADAFGFLGGAADGASNNIVEFVRQGVHAATTLKEVKKAAEAAAAEERRIERATDAAADAAEDHDKALQDEVDALDAVADAAKAQSDAQRAAADSTFAVKDATSDYAAFLKGLPAAIKEAKGNQGELNDIYAEGRDNAVTLADAVQKNAEEQFASAGVTLGAVDKLDLWNKSMLDSAKTADGPLRDAILGYIGEANDIPPEKITEISTLIDDKKFDEAQALLDDASEARKVTLQLEIDERSAQQAEARKEAVARLIKIPVFFDAPKNVPRGGFTIDNDTGGAPKNATGTDKWTGGLTWVGEKGKELVILPEGSGIVPNDQVREVPGHAGGVDPSTPRVQNISHTSIAAPAAAPSEAPSVELVDPRDAIQAQDELQAAMFETADIGLSTYRDYLKGRESAEVKWSAEWMRIHREIAGLNKAEADEAQARADEQKKLDEEAAEAAQKRADDEADAAQKQSDLQDKLHKRDYEQGRLSLADYQAYLLERQEGLDQYSDQAIDLWDEIYALTKSAQDAAADAAADAEKDEKKRADDAREAEEKATKDHLDRIQDLFDAARERKAYGDAVADVEGAMGGLGAAVGASQVKGLSAADRQAALVDLEQAKQKAADALYKRADAGANAAGIDDGTPEWASSVRISLEGDKANAPALAAYIDNILSGIPMFARGGVMPGPRGQHSLALVAGGEEVLTEEQQAARAGGSSVFNISVNAGMGSDGSQIGKQIVAHLKDWERANGRKIYRAS